MIYGNIMKEIRTYDLHTQKEIAKILGIKEDTYSKYERQVKLIPLKHLNTFCNHFNISIDYILNLSQIKCYNNSISKLDKHRISERLKEFRKSNKLTQKQLADRLKYNRSLISKYEDEKAMISLDFLYKICTEYHISADYLLGKTNQNIS